MKTYMAYSRYVGSAQGAFLVFAHTAREAKKVAWTEVKDVLVDSCVYIDLAVRMIKSDDKYLFELGDQEKLNNGIPHVVDQLPSCPICLMWDSRLGDDGLCDCCREEKQEWLENAGCIVKGDGKRSWP